jgi:hypothetical protein
VHAILLCDGKEINRDDNDDAIANDRDFNLRFKLDDGRKVRIEAGWVSLVKTGIAVYVDEELSYESHPGKTLKSPLGAYGMSAKDLISPTISDSEDSAPAEPLNERDQSFDDIQKKQQSYTRLFLAAIVIVAVWNIFTSRPGIDTVIMASAVFISGLAAQYLLRVPTLSGGGVAITIFLLSYGLFQQFILANDMNNKLGLTFIALSITIGYFVYYLYYRFVPDKNNPNRIIPRLPNAEIKRSVIFFVMLAAGNALFALFASDELFGLWNLISLILIFLYIFSPMGRQKSAGNSNGGKVGDRLMRRTKKPKTRKKPNTDK